MQRQARQVSMQGGSHHYQGSTYLQHLIDGLPVHWLLVVRSLVESAGEGAEWEQLLYTDLPVTEGESVMQSPSPQVLGQFGGLGVISLVPSISDLCVW